MSKILVIPDTQVKRGVCLDHLRYAGMWAAEKRPDVIVQLGDFADMESLSSYDIGKRDFEGRRYTTDIEIAKEAMRIFMEPIIAEQQKIIRCKEKRWKPRMILTLGNHEQRINKAVNNDPKLDGLISINDLEYSRWGWEVYPFLEVVVIDGVAFSHYFVSGVLGRPVTSARMLTTKHHMSCIAGHQQGKDIAYSQAADGRRITSIISGSFYSHTENYLNAQTNIHWRGIWQLNEVNEGAFDEMPLSLEYLRRKYGC